MFVFSRKYLVEKHEKTRNLDTSIYPASGRSALPCTEVQPKVKSDSFPSESCDENKRKEETKQSYLYIVGLILTLSAFRIHLLSL